MIFNLKLSFSCFLAALLVSAAFSPAFAQRNSKRSSKPIRLNEEVHETERLDNFDCLRITASGKILSGTISKNGLQFKKYVLSPKAKVKQAKLRAVIKRLKKSLKKNPDNERTQAALDKKTAALEKLNPKTRKDSCTERFVEKDTPPPPPPEEEVDDEGFLALNRTPTDQDVRNLFRKAGYGGTTAELQGAMSARNSGVASLVNYFFNLQDESEVDCTAMKDWDSNDAIDKRGMENYLICKALHAAPWQRWCFEWTLSIVTIGEDPFVDNDEQISVMNEYYSNIEQFCESPDLDFKILYDFIVNSAAQSIFLDNDLNDKQAPNENLSREAMELFSMGDNERCNLDGELTPNYSDLDISESARAFTGWRYLPGEHGRAVYVPQNQDPDPKVMFAGTADQVLIHDIDDFVAKIIFDKREKQTAQFLATEMVRYMVAEQSLEGTDCSYIRTLARDILASDFKLAGPMKKMLQSQTFYDSSPTIMSSPFQYYTQMARARGVENLGTAQQAVDAIYNLLTSAGLRMIAPVDGVFWNFQKSYTNAATLIKKYNGIQAAIFQSSFQPISEIDQLTQETVASDAMPILISYVGCPVPSSQLAALTELLNINDAGVASTYEDQNLSEKNKRLRSVVQTLSLLPQCLMK
jgi:hypothetical protein